MNASKDDRLDINQLEHYLLCIQIGKRDVQIMVADSKSHRCLLLEDYIISDYGSIAEKLKSIQSIFENHHLLMARFWKNILLSFKSEKFSIVPLEYFLKEHARDYLKLNCRVDIDTEGVGYYKIGKLDAANVFSFEREILNWLRELYGKPNVRVTHQGGMLINALLEKNKQNKQKQISVYIDRFYMHIIVQKGHSLLFYNQFGIKSFDDYIKYINLSLHEFSLSKNGTSVELYGFIKDGSSHLKALKKEYAAIRLGERPDFLKFGYMFDEIDEHKYLDIFGIYLNN